MTIVTNSTTLDHPPAPRRGLRARWAPVPGPSGGTLSERVMAARGVDDAFLDPRLGDLHDPSGIPDLDRAAQRLLDAARAGEPVIIYGDYDVDGVTASAILFHTLAALAPETSVRIYIPHRVDEGYGINADAIRTLADEGARLVVSVDCGITAVEPAKVARSLGLDLIITDHHNPPASLDDLPDAFAVVHPRRPDSTYPFGDLCGAGVAYKLAWRLCTLACGSDRVTDTLRRLLVELLAFASLGVVADAVPLLDENRVIARHGLRRVRTSPFAGLRALVEASGLAGGSIAAEDAGFRLAPRLNAIGRLGHAREAAELLTTHDPALASGIAEKLSRINDQRRRIERDITNQADELAEHAGMTARDRRAIVLAGEDWHPGVVGIVCSRLVDRHHRPTILLTREGDGLRGSGRSIDGFNLHGALERCADLLTGFGGHDMAAGLRLRADALDAFTDRFVGVCNESLRPEDLVATVRFDTACSIDELTTGEVRRLEALAPHGRANPAPRVLVTGLRVAERPRPFGRTGDHLDVRVRAGSRHMRLVGWGWAAHKDAIPAGAGIDAVVEPRLSNWNGRTRVEPTLIDLAVQG